ncbi:MAG TPA: late competence development ComFB family protein [Burkholderiaceae bacterium]|nr:late competence development ComFB family protein [Burkholderiaceae bacterium]
MKDPDFGSIHNHYERAVFDEVLAQVKARPGVESKLLADIACVALNQLPPRYIRHDVDFAFFLTQQEREHGAQLIRDAVSYAFDFVVARARMKLPRNGPQTAVVTRVARKLVASSRKHRAQ